MVVAESRLKKLREDDEGLVKDLNDLQQEYELLQKKVRQMESELQASMKPVGVSSVLPQLTAILALLFLAVLLVY
jgi:hypothetical protein